MFRYYFKLPQNSSAHNKKNIAAIFVTDYYSTKSFQADKVFFVIGSDIHGPMGKELVPVYTKKAAETFKQDHKGTSILTFDQVTVDMLTGN